MTVPRLSICIPVYNFAAFLGATLESILPQLTEEVELIVLDGGSTDGTPELVRGFQARLPRLSYVRREKKGGIDRDMAHAVAAASGEYVWPFSGDDLMRPDAIARVLAELPAACDVYLLETLLCGFDMAPISMLGMLELTTPRTFRLDDRQDRLDYFGHARNSAAYFSFCSSLVIKKSRWDAASIDDSFYGSCWAHAARLMSLIPAGLTVRYLPEAFLEKRGDNDSFLTNGLVHRFGIAVDGYHKIADTFFGHDSPEAEAIRRTLQREMPWSSWFAAKIDLGVKGRFDQLDDFHRLLRKQFPGASPRSALARVACLTPLSLLLVVRRIVQRLRGAPHEVARR